MARHVITDSGARLIAQFGGVVGVDAEAAEIGIVIVGAHPADTDTEVGMQHAEQAVRRFEVVPQVGEHAVGTIEAVGSSEVIVVQIVGTMIQFQFGAQTVSEGIASNQTGRPALIEVDLVSGVSVLPEVLGLFPVEAALDTYIGPIIRHCDQRRASKQQGGQR